MKDLQDLRLFQKLTPRIFGASMPTEVSTKTIKAHAREIDNLGVLMEIHRDHITDIESRLKLLELRDRNQPLDDNEIKNILDNVLPAKCEHCGK